MENSVVINRLSTGHIEKSIYPTGTAKMPDDHRADTKQNRVIHRKLIPRRDDDVRATWKR